MDVLINNAGIAGPLKQIADLTGPDAQQVFNTNVFSNRADDPHVPAAAGEVGRANHRERVKQRRLVRGGARPSTDEVLDPHWANTVRADRESLAYARRAFGAVALSRLTPAALADWSVAVKSKDAAALAPATRRRAIVTLRSVLAHAVRMRWLPHDPSIHLSSPEQKAVTATAAGDIWTPQQMTAFLDHIATHRLGGCFALTLLGLRREEVGGLRWSDIDLQASVMRVRQARVDVNGCDTIVAPKTDRSARELPLPPRELAMLRAMKREHKTEHLAVGHPLTEDDLLLSRADGTPLPVREYSREYAAQRSAVGLPAITLAKLRHSNISRMRAAGVPADVVAAWHGHTERMTQAIYGRVTDDRLTAAAGVFSQHLRTGIQR